MTSKKVTQINEPVIIDNFSAFNDWRKEFRTFRLSSGSGIFTFDLPELSADENKNISNLINSYNKECGCNAGKVLMSCAFIITIIGYFITGGNFSSIGFRQLGWLAGITFLGALAGKLLGLLRARWKLIKLSDNIHEKLHNAYSK